MATFFLMDWKSPLRFVSRDEAAGLPMAPWTKEMVTRAFEYKGTTYFARPTWRPPSPTA
jgi:hypothetical protein